MSMNLKVDNAPKIECEIVGLAELLLRGSFYVPWHQRYYDWRETEVKDLLYDLWSAFENRRRDLGRHAYFLGSIVLSERQGVIEDEWDINDGQQRLITFSMLLACILAKVPPEMQYPVLRCIFQVDTFESFTMDSVDDAHPRIQPQRDDKTPFKGILQGKTLGVDGKQKKAYKVIADFLDKDEHDGKISSFLDFLLKRVNVALLRVPVEIDANAVFEALNGRGKPLSQLDLVRNHICSHFSLEGAEQHREEVRGHLEGLMQIFGGRGGGKNNTEHYFRSFFQCEYGFLRARQLHKDVRDKLQPPNSDKNPGKVRKLVQCMWDDADLFRRILSAEPDKDLTRAFTGMGRGPGRRRIENYFGELKDYTVSHSLLFALLRRVFGAKSEGDRAVAEAVFRSVGNLASFVTRTVFVSRSFPAYKLDAPFAREAERISRVKRVEGLCVLPCLHESDDAAGSVMRDRRFEEKLAEMRFQNKGKEMAKAMRCLWFVNRANQKQEWTTLPLNPDSGYTVEHVLPVSKEHWKDWNGFANGEAEDCVNLIGNMVLLGRDANKSGSQFNSSFERKKKTYAKSPLELTQEVAGVKDPWTQDKVFVRCKKIAKRAAKTWGFVEAKI